MFREYSVKVILIDLEGTTTSITFVKDVLFPYAKAHVRNYLTETWNTESTRSIITDLKGLSEYKNFNEKSEFEESIDSIVEFVNYLIDNDLKLGPLKTLQGHIWSKGYEDGCIKGHFYNDVPEALKNWQKAGIRIAVYSSGSVKAQKLLFRHAEAGDLSSLIEQHFDTSSGQKQCSESYRSITKSLNVQKPSDILFLTDVVKEAEAAQEAGLLAAILDRPNNAPLTKEDRQRFEILPDFSKLKVK